VCAGIDRGVVAGATVEAVVARAAGEVIVADAADQLIIAGAAGGGTPAIDGVALLVL
jgi:hypothetical protein